MEKRYDYEQSKKILDYVSIEENAKILATAGIFGRSNSGTTVYSLNKIPIAVVESFNRAGNKILQSTYAVGREEDIRELEEFLSPNSYTLL